MVNIAITLQDRTLVLFNMAAKLVSVAQLVARFARFCP